jgi:hypothetical protein
MKKDASIETQLRNSEVRLLTALRKLSQVGDAEALGANPDDLVRIEEALAQLWRAQEQFEHLSRLADAMPLDATRH